MRLRNRMMKVANNELEDFIDKLLNQNEPMVDYSMDSIKDMYERALTENRNDLNEEEKSRIRESLMEHNTNTFLNNQVKSYEWKKQRYEYLPNVIMDAYSLGNKELAKQLEEEYSDLHNLFGYVDNKKEGMRLRNRMMKVAQYTEEEQLSIIKNDPYAIQHMENPSEEAQLEAVKYDGRLIKFINNPSEAVQLEAVSDDGYAIGHINNPSESVQLEAVKQNCYAIRVIENPSEQVKLEVVKCDGCSIKYIQNPSDELKLEAVKQDGDAIRYIINQTETLQLEAVKQNGDSIFYIENPTEKAQLEALKYDMDNLEHIENSQSEYVIYLNKKLESGLEKEQLKEVLNGLLKGVKIDQMDKYLNFNFHSDMIAAMNDFTFDIANGTASPELKETYRLILEDEEYRNNYTEAYQLMMEWSK